MNPIEKDFEIPADVVLPCPRYSFQQVVRVAKVCTQCPGFHGICRMTADKDKQGNPIPWHERFAVRCAGIVERRTRPIPKVIEE